MYDPGASTPDMAFNVSLGDFHQTHEKARAAVEVAESGLLGFLLISELKQVLSDLRAGQELTDAETGSDRVWATSYYKEIGLVQTELKRRSEST